MLNRMHVDAVRSRDNSCQVRFESLNRFELKGDLIPLRNAFEETATVADSIFEYLHILAKQSLASYLTQQMAERIRLHAAG